MANFRTLILSGLFSLAFVLAEAQQDAQFSMFMFNQMYFNPAYAGADGTTRLQIHNRFQWVGYQPTFDDGGAPNTLVVSASVPFAPIKGALGVHFTSDRIGPAGNQEVQLSYAYKTYINDNEFSIGARAGFYNRFLDFNQLRARDAGDPLIPSGRISQTQPDFAIGALYDASTFYVGLSVNHLNRAKFPFGAAQASNALTSNVYLMGGYRWEPVYALEIQPLAIVKSEMNFSPKTLSFEAGVLATYDETYFAGLTYRWQDSGNLIFGANMLDSRLRLAYALDLVFGNEIAKAPTSHEISLSYALPVIHFGKKSIIRTPRFRY